MKHNYNKLLILAGLSLASRFFLASATATAKPNEVEFTEQQSDPLRLLEPEQDLAVALNGTDGREQKFENLSRWEQYQRHYHKHYASMTEATFRLGQFVATSIKVARQWLAYRYHHSTSYFFKLNRFSDLTPQEKMYKFAVRSNEVDKHDLRRDHDESKQIDDHPTEPKIRQKRGIGSFFGRWRGSEKSTSDYTIDWRNYCLPQKAVDQGDCGCCYAMATTRMFEWLDCNVEGKLNSFSEQYILDCGDPYGLYGCENGTIKGTLEFVKERGLVLAEVAPYEAIQHDSCNINKATLQENQFRLPKNVEHKIARTMQDQEWDLRKSPLIAFVCLDDDFFDYAGGIYIPRQHDMCWPDSLGHFMLLVGAGHDQKVGDFWLFLNSYGPEWGESNGFMRISRSPFNAIGYTIRVMADF